jgi:hypothetical protein
MKALKPKALQPNLRDKLSESFLRAFESDFEIYGVNVIEQLRKSSKNNRRCRTTAVTKRFQPVQNDAGIGL